MRLTHVQKLTFTALFAALTFVATKIIQIPTPATSGYIHLGDALVVLCGIFLGPVYGALAAGIGSSLSDLLSGYLIYAPATFVIKALAAFLVALAFKKLSIFLKSAIVKCAVGGIISTFVVTIGYLAYEFVLYGGAAIGNIPSNILQGTSGLVISSLLLPALLKIPVFKQMITEN